MCLWQLLLPAVLMEGTVRLVATRVLVATRLYNSHAYVHKRRSQNEEHPGAKAAPRGVLPDPITPRFRDSHLQSTAVWSGWSSMQATVDIEQLSWRLHTA